MKQPARCWFQVCTTLKKYTFYFFSRQTATGPVSGERYIEVFSLSCSGGYDPSWLSAFSYITGIGGWDNKTFINVIRTDNGGQLRWTMPWVEYRNISDSDLSAILTALKTLPPVRHQIVNGKKPTLCAVCGSLHGYGDQNKIKPIIPIAMNTKLYPTYAGVYADSEKNTVIILSKDHKLLIKMGGEDDKGIELVPVARNEFNGSGLPSPISFLTNAAGRLTGFTDHDLVPMIFLKVNSGR